MTDETVLPPVDPTTELRIREQELELKAREQNRLDRETTLKEREFERGKYQSSGWIATIGICGAILGAVSTIVGAWMTGHFTLESQINNNKAVADLEQQKAEAQRFIEMMKTDFNKGKADEVIRFLADAGFISKTERNSGILSYTGRGAEIGSKDTHALNFSIDKDDPRNASGRGGPYGMVNNGKPFLNINSYFQSVELSDHCKKVDDVCQIYVGSAVDTQDIWRAFHLPYWPIDVGVPEKIGDLINRLNAYNASHPENVASGRSAAVMVIDGLAGSAKEKNMQLNGGR